MRRQVLCGIGCLAVALLLGVRADGAVVLVEDQVPKSTIVVPRDASNTVLHAADELAAYLQQISGAEVPRVAEGHPVRGTAVYVGVTDAGAETTPGELADAPEAVFWSVEGDRVVLRGGSDLATLMTVYRFLQQSLGCRWLAPDAEFVPSRATIRLDEQTVLSRPSFSMRTFKATSEATRNWGLKVGMNGFFRPDDLEDAAGTYYLPDRVPGCHAYYCLMPNDPYFQQRPEWFPLVDGRRVPGDLHGSQLCVTAPGLADEFARNVIRCFEEDPTLETISISPNDGRGWCQCDACRELDERLCGSRMTTMGLTEDRPFRGDRVFWFANQVAERVGKVYPDKELLVLAYNQYSEPPDTIVPASNVVPWLCHFAPADYSRPIADPRSEANAQFNQRLTRWAERAPHLLFYSYVSKSMWWRLPRPVTHTFAADVKYLHSLGIRRYYCQSSLSDWAEAGPLFYVVTALLWDVEADPDAVIDDWVQHMFGPGAAAMREFYDAVRQSVVNTGQPYSDQPARDVPGLYDLAELDRALAALDSARGATADSEIHRQRVEQVSEVFTYGYHFARCLDLTEQFRVHPSRSIMAEAMRHGEAALEIYRHPYAARYFDNLRMSEKMGLVTTGFGDETRRGGRACWNADETGLGDGKAGWATFLLEAADRSKPLVVEIDVWGESDSLTVSVNTGGLGRSYADGGVWTRISPNEPLAREATWQTLVFVFPPESLAPDSSVQRFGLGGGDRQTWIAEIRVRDARDP